MKKGTLILLILFTLFAVILNFLPHLNYNYPLHVDEWVHFQYANHLSTGSPLYFGENYKSLEAGFHYILATLNVLGVPYLFMFGFATILLTVLVCLGVFILTRKIWNETAALFSILFIALLQSSVAFLGLVFLVPMVIGLFFILIGLYLVKINSKAWILVLASILIIHPPTALALILLINIEFLIKRKDYFRNLSYQLISGLIALPFYIPFFISRGTETLDALSFSPIVTAIFIPQFIGWFSLIIVAGGIYFISEKKNYSIFAYVLSLLAFILIFYYLKLEVFIPYARALMYLFIILTIPFGICCERIINFSKKSHIQIIIGIILIALILFFSLPLRIDSNNYIYHVIDSKDYSAFNWIKDNTQKDAIAVLDPWKANAFTPIAERQVYSRIVQGPNAFYEARNNEIYQFFKNNCTNSSFLAQNNISIVYGDCNNSNLKEVYPNVYLKS